MKASLFAVTLAAAAGALVHCITASPDARALTTQRLFRRGISASRLKRHRPPPPQHLNIPPSGPSFGATLHTKIEGPAKIKVSRGQIHEKHKVKHGDTFEKTWPDPKEVTAVIKTKGGSHETILTGRRAYSDYKIATMSGGLAVHRSASDGIAGPTAVNDMGQNPLRIAGFEATRIAASASGKVRHELGVAMK